VSRPAVSRLAHHPNQLADRFRITHEFCKTVYQRRYGVCGFGGVGANIDARLYAVGTGYWQYQFVYRQLGAWRGSQRCTRHLGRWQ
jgi:hypothetical protein